MLLVRVDVGTRGRKANYTGTEVVTRAVTGGEGDHQAIKGYASFFIFFVRLYIAKEMK